MLHGSWWGKNYCMMSEALAFSCKGLHALKIGPKLFTVTPFTETFTMFPTAVACAVPSMDAGVLDEE